MKSFVGSKRVTLPLAAMRPRVELIQPEIENAYSTGFTSAGVGVAIVSALVFV